MLTLERLSTLNRLSKAGLSIDLVGAYTLDQLADGCDRLERENIEPHRFRFFPTIQCALMDDPAFLQRYRELVMQNVEDQQIENWLKVEHETNCRLMEHTTEELLAAFRADLPGISVAQWYLLYFLGRGLSESQLETVQSNLRYVCSKDSTFLSAWDEPQRDILLHPFVRVFLSRTEIGETIPLLAAAPHLPRFLDRLYAVGLNMCFGLDELKLLASHGEDEIAGLQPVFDALGNDPCRMEHFLLLWLDNGGHMGDLKPFVSMAEKRTPEELDQALDTRLSYLNLLYGGTLDGIPFGEVPSHALPLLSYALANRQKAFLRLVTQNFVLVCALDRDCILFSSHFYSRIALNSITQKNLRTLQSDGRNATGENAIAELDPRAYTFDELRALHSMPVRYAHLYNRLTIPRVDDRLLVLRQLTRRKL